MADKHEEMARQMRADGVSEETIARFVAEEMEGRRVPPQQRASPRSRRCGEWRKIPEHIRKLLLVNAFCHNCGTTGSRPATRCACATAACSSRSVRGMRRRGGKAVRLAVHGILPGIGSRWTSSAPGTEAPPNRCANPFNEKVSHYRSANHAHNQEESA